MARIQCKGCDHKPSIQDTIDGYCMICVSKKMRSYDQLQANLKQWKENAFLALSTGMERLNELELLTKKYDKVNGNSSGKIIGLQAQLTTAKKENKELKEVMQEGVDLYTSDEEGVEGWALFSGWIQKLIGVLK